MLGRNPDGPSRSHPTAPAERGHAQAFGHGYPVRLRALGQPRLGAVPAALDLLGGCAVPQGLQRVVLVHRNHDSRFATETDDVVTVVL